MQHLLDGQELLLLMNKIDKEVEEAQHFMPHLPRIRISAKKGVGIDELEQFLVDSISQSNLENSSVEHNIRHINILEKIQTGLEDIEMAFEQSVPSDLIAIDKY